MTGDDDDDLTEEEHLTNPAGRLLLLFNYLREKGGLTTQAQPISTKSLVAGYLGVDPDDQSAYFRVIAGVLQLPVDARLQIGALVGSTVPKGMLLRPLDAVEAALPQVATSRSKAHEFNAMIDAGVTAGLSVASAVLFHHLRVIPVNVDSLNHIRSLATEVIDALSDTSIPADLRETLLAHAQRLVVAVNSYKVRGSSGIIQEMDGLTGALVRNSGRVAGFWELPVVKTIIALGGAVAAVTTLINAPLAITEGVQSIFEMLPAAPISIEAPAEHPIEAEIIEDNNA